MRADSVRVVFNRGELGTYGFSHPPVGYYRAVVSPFFSQDYGYRIVVVMTPHAVDFVVTCHNIDGLAFLDAYLEAFEINLSQRAFGNPAVIDVTLYFLIVARKVFGTGGFAITLYSVGKSTREFTAEERVFRIVFEIAAAKRIAVYIHTRAEKYVGRVMLHLHSDFFIEIFNQRGIPRACKRTAARQKRVVTSYTYACGAVGGYDRHYAFVGQ